METDSTEAVARSAPGLSSVATSVARCVGCLVTAESRVTPGVVTTSVR